MMTRRELESLLGTKLTDEQWKENEKIFSEVLEKMYDEDHPLDD